MLLALSRIEVVEKKDMSSKGDFRALGAHCENSECGEVEREREIFLYTSFPLSPGTLDNGVSIIKRQLHDISSLK